ncbi:MAG: hypothetical protein L6R37_007753 [Teloschistes peruensis]|nr:MAG: hypothetical protein L6R37_007753 [Teloschistes peruensis]
MERVGLAYQLTLERNRNRQLGVELTTVGTYHRDLKSTHQRLQGHFQLCRARIEALESSHRQKQANFQAEHRLRATLESQLLMERESNDKADLRLTRALTTIDELASTLHLMRVDSACLSENQKEELRTFDYTEVLLHRDALLVESAELRSMLARGSVDH